MDYQAIDDLSERLCRDLELRKEPSRGTSGRALLISWADELSTEQDNLLDNLRCILRDDYRYTVRETPPVWLCPSRSAIEGPGSA